MRENRIRAAGMRNACCACFNICRVSRDWSAKTLIADLVSALRRIASLSFQTWGGLCAIVRGMWDILQLLWYMFLYVFGMVIVPTWIAYKVFSWLFPCDD